MNAQKLIDEIKRLQTYKLSENDDLILISKEQVIDKILIFFIEYQNNCLKLVIGD